jgi:hypothetical protein
MMTRQPFHGPVGGGAEQDGAWREAREGSVGSDNRHRPLILPGQVAHVSHASPCPPSLALLDGGEGAQRRADVQRADGYAAITPPRT